MSEAGDGIGSLATGALWARTVGHADFGAHEGADDAGACANCGMERVGPFCHACGQLGHVHRNLTALVHDIAHGVFHFEGRVWHTLPLLALHPGRLTRRYIDGERAKFVSPMALFLFSVFLMFAVVSNLSSHNGTTNRFVTGQQSLSDELAKANAKLAALKTTRAQATNDAERRAIDDQIMDTQNDLNGLQVVERTGLVGQGPKADAARRELAQKVHLDTGWSWLDRGVHGMSDNPALTLYKMKTYGYKYSWALIPISLPFIWLLFAFRRDVGLYDHAIFSIYSLSFMSLGVVVLTLLSWIGLTGGLITLAAMMIPPVHMYRQLKGTYALGRYGAAWRTAALLIITTITSSLFITFLFYMGTD